MHYTAVLCCRFSPWVPSTHEAARSDMLTRKVKPPARQVAGAGN